MAEVPTKKLSTRTGRTGIALRTGLFRGCLHSAAGCGVLLIAFMVSLPVHAWGRVGPRLAPLPRDAVVLAYGDSLTYGIGAVYGESYPAVLEKLIGRKVVSAGMPGELTAAGLKRLPQVLGKVRPHLVILCHGCNDLIHGVDERQVSNNLRAMINLCQENGAEVVLIGVPRYQQRVLNPPPRLYRMLAEHFDIPYTGNALQVILANRSFRADAVHPNGDGYRRLAETLAHLLRMSGAI
jgi:acyl-CoA thioesterase-1